MKRINFWNKLFHAEQLKAEFSKFIKAESILGFANEVLERIETAKSLWDLVEAHKFMWEKNFRNENLAPCKWGMFRTESIPEMKPEEVYLGNIYGLWTHTIPQWENCKEDESEAYRKIFNQYKMLLKSNFNKIVDDAQTYKYAYSGCVNIRKAKEYFGQ